MTSFAIQAAVAGQDRLLQYHSCLRGLVSPAGLDLLYNVGVVPQHQWCTGHHAYDEVHHTRGQQ